MNSGVPLNPQPVIDCPSGCVLCARFDICVTFWGDLGLFYYANVKSGAIDRAPSTMKQADLQRRAWSPRRTTTPSLVVSARIPTHRITGDPCSMESPAELVNSVFSIRWLSLPAAYEYLIIGLAIGSHLVSLAASNGILEVVRFATTHRQRIRITRRFR